MIRYVVDYDKIETIRKECGFTLRQISVRMGYHPDYYRAAKYRNSTIEEIPLMRLLKILGIGNKSDIIKEETDMPKKKASLPKVYIQDMNGNNIPYEDLLKKVISSEPEATDVYIKPGENAAYWVNGDDTGKVEIW